MTGVGRVGVIGGGLGGLAAACTLAARGHAVTIFEKSSWLGGKAAVLEGNGFRFDMGPTILTLPSVLKRIFAEAGRDLYTDLPMVRLDPEWRSFFDDGSRLDLVDDAAAMAKRLDAFAPGTATAEGYRAFLAFSKKLHTISERFFFWRSIGSLWDMFDFRNMINPGMLSDVLQMRMGKTVAECVRQHVPEPRVAQMLDHFTQYVGSAPDASPAVLCGIAHMQTDEGIWYPQGGTASVPRALAKLAQSLGVDVRLNCDVRRILVEGKTAAGVETTGGEQVPLSAIVSNCDSVRSHRELLQGSTAAAKFERRRRYEPACSGVVLYLGLDRAYEQLAHHNFVFSHDAEEEFEAIYRKGEPAHDPTCYVCAPARTEPSVAPPGGEALYILVHTPYLRQNHNWDTLFPHYRQVILDKLKKTAGLTDIESRIRFEGKLTPVDIRDRYRTLDGAIYGLASHGRMFGAFKPANRSPDIKGLYLAGGAAHPGPGMPMVLMSGWIAADTLHNDGVAQPKSSMALAATASSATPLSVMPLGAHASAVAIPQRSDWLVRLFTRYCRYYIRKNFHALRLSKQGRPCDEIEGPLVVVVNHPSWWDPLVCLVLAQMFTKRLSYGPIEASALSKYRFFERLGFFGVEPGTRQGGLHFLRTAGAILEKPGTAIWMTPQGKFSDPRERPVRFRPGVAHLVHRLEGGAMVPLALEYPHWSERFPEVLARFGEPIPIGRGRDRSAEDWQRCLEAGMERTQDALAAEALTRNPADFDLLLGGSAGVGGIYDLWRRARAWLSGRRFQAAHGLDDTAAVVGSLP